MSLSGSLDDSTMVPGSDGVPLSAGYAAYHGPGAPGPSVQAQAALPAQAVNPDPSYSNLALWSFVVVGIIVVLLVVGFALFTPDLDTMLRDKNYSAARRLLDSAPSTRHDAVRSHHDNVLNFTRTAFGTQPAGPAFRSFFNDYCLFLDEFANATDLSEACLAGKEVIRTEVNTLIEDAVAEAAGCDFGTGDGCEGFVLASSIATDYLTVYYNDTHGCGHSDAVYNDGTARDKLVDVLASPFSNYTPLPRDLGTLDYPQSSFREVSRVLSALQFVSDKAEWKGLVESIAGGRAALPESSAGRLDGATSMTYGAVSAEVLGSHQWTANRMKKLVLEEEADVQNVKKRFIALSYFQLEPVLKRLIEENNEYELSVELFSPKGTMEHLLTVSLFNDAAYLFDEFPTSIDSDVNKIPLKNTIESFHRKRAESSIEGLRTGSSLKECIETDLNQYCRFLAEFSDAGLETEFYQRKIATELSSRIKRVSEGTRTCNGDLDGCNHLLASIRFLTSFLGSFQTLQSCGHLTNMYSNEIHSALDGLVGSISRSFTVPHLPEDWTEWIERTNPYSRLDDFKRISQLLHNLHELETMDEYFSIWNGLKTAFEVGSNALSGESAVILKNVTSLDYKSVAKGVLGSFNMATELIQVERLNPSGACVKPDHFKPLLEMTSAVLDFESVMKEELERCEGKGLKFKRLDMNAFFANVRELSDDGVKKLREYPLQYAKHVEVANCYYLHMQSITDHFDKFNPNFSETPRKLKKVLEDEWKGKVSKTCEEARKSKGISQLARSLANIRLLMSPKGPGESLGRECIKGILEPMANEEGAKVMARLGSALSSLTGEESIGRKLVEEFNDLLPKRAPWIRKGTIPLNVRGVLDQAEGSYLKKGEYRYFIYHKSPLEEMFDRFEVTFNEKMKPFLDKPDADLRNTRISDIVSDIHNHVEEVCGHNPSDRDHFEYSERQIKCIPELVGKLAAVYAICSAADNSWSENPGLDSRARRDYLHEIRDLQVIAVFRMLSVDFESREPFLLNNHLAEIRTGEGKSLVLAIVSSVLSLLGADVSIACYSPYLSERDSQANDKFFKELEVRNFVQYYTIDRLTAKVYQVEATKKMTSEYLGLPYNEASSPSMSGNDKSYKILLFDEVDVFFKLEYFGNLYKPDIVVKNKNITRLVKKIWDSKCSLPEGTVIEEMEEFVAVQESLPKLPVLLLRDAVVQMLHGCKNHDNPYPLKLYRNKDNFTIGYEDQDSISYEQEIAYQTMFSYFHWKEKEPRVDAASHCHLNILVGKYSYAEVPRFFSSVLGVSGTIKTLSEDQWIALEQYGIKYHTYFPATFGPRKENKLFESRSKSDVIIVPGPPENFHMELSNEIKERLKGKFGGKRAVLVVFKSDTELDSYLKSDYCTEELKVSIRALTENATLDMRNEFVKRTERNQISLFTRSFGRGSDFTCDNDDVNNNGGVHVIQTFFSIDPSESSQIKGRTMRAGEDGSYSLVLSESDLVKDLDVTIEELQECQKDKNGCFEFLNTTAMKMFNEMTRISNKKVIDVLPIHEKSIEFLNDLRRGNEDQVMEFISNQLVENDLTSEVVFCLDNSGSMIHYHQLRKDVVRALVKEISKNENFRASSSSVRFGLVAFIDVGVEPIVVHKVSVESESVIENLEALRPHDGGDIPEDVLGALDYCLGDPVGWQKGPRAQLRTVVLISESPPHGRDYYYRPLEDDYPDGVPGGPTLEEIAQKFHDQNTMLWFLQLGSGTQKMSNMLAESFSDVEANIPKDALRFGVSLARYKEINLLRDEERNGPLYSNDFLPEVPNHHIFCLDSSWSMEGKPWKDVVIEFKSHVSLLRKKFETRDHISVISFGETSEISHEYYHVSDPLLDEDPPFTYGRKTIFAGALEKAIRLGKVYLQSNEVPVIYFMSDGEDNHNKEEAEKLFASLPEELGPNYKCHVLKFGDKGFAMQQRLDYLAGLGRCDKYSTRDSKEFGKALLDISRSREVGQIMGDVHKLVSEVMDEVSEVIRIVVKGQRY